MKNKCQCTFAGYKWCIVHHGAVQKPQNNPEKGTIKDVEEQAYGDNVTILICMHNNITCTAPWIDNAIPIHNFRYILHHHGIHNLWALRE